MPEGPSTDAGDSIWRKLRASIFGEEASLRDQLEDVIERHEDDPAPDAAGDLTPLERQMVRNLLHFGERDAGEVGVPRADIIAVEEQTGFADLVRQFAEGGHSRMPVYRGSLDEVVGMIHLKDVFALLGNGVPPPATLAPLIRQPLYVPMSMGALDLLAEMRSKRVHLAIVLDEYSGTEGLVTIEDLIEEITGAIEDEHDEAPTALLVPLDGGAWDADARVELEDVAETVDPAFGGHDEDVDTLGGLAAVIAGRVPARGERLATPSGWMLEILASDARRVERLRLHPPRPAPKVPTHDH